MKHATTAVLVIFLAANAFCQDAAPANPPLVSRNFSFGGFELATGAGLDGVGATVKGERDLIIAPHTFVNYGVDAALSSDADKLNQSSVFVKPGWFKMGPHIVPAWTVYLDLRYQFGEFKNGDATDKVNQGTVGAQVRWFPPYFIQRAEDNFPRLRRGQQPADCDFLPPDHPDCKDFKPGAVIEAEFPIGVYLEYAHPVSTDSEALIPKDIDADKLILKLKGDTRVSEISQRLWLLLDVSASYPMRGDRELQTKVDVGLAWETGTKVKPLVKYVSGKEGGFEYDRQVIAGVLMSIAGR